MTKFLYRIVFLSFSLPFPLIGENDARRIGRLNHVSWEEYFALGANQSTYASGALFPDLTVVGALVSNSNELGTATLIAPNFIVTAAHVIKNTVSDTPIPSEWKFYMGDNLSSGSSSSWSSQNAYTIKQFFVHQGWTDRQTSSNRLGDGDALGVDLAIAELDQNVIGFFPARLPDANDDPLGLRAVLAGYGTLVDGGDGSSDSSNRKRTGAENIIDRSVQKVSKAGVPDISLGGLLGIDFDSPSGASNSLGSGSIDNLGTGSSSSTPLGLEASTARGDSGGPAFVFTKEAWRVHGVVSYGTDDSTYGDVTVYTRLASHYAWIHDQLPSWHNAKVIGEENWLESPWLGPLFPYDSKWNFFTNLGWLYVNHAIGESFWGWNHLIQDWIWMSSELYPYIYLYASKNWIYISVSNSNALSIRGYDFAQKKWKTFTGK